MERGSSAGCCADVQRMENEISRRVCGNKNPDFCRLFLHRLEEQGLTDVFHQQMDTPVLKQVLEAVNENDEEGLSETHHRALDAADPTEMMRAADAYQRAVDAEHLSRLLLDRATEEHKEAVDAKDSCKISMDRAAEAFRDGDLIADIVQIAVNLVFCPDAGVSAPLCWPA